MKTVEQMALLNCLMYYDIKFEKDYTLEEIILELQSNEEGWNELMDSHPGVISKRKTKAVMDAIMQDERMGTGRVLFYLENINR